jgi:hypothetical protein
MNIKPVYLLAAAILILAGCRSQTVDDVDKNMQRVVSTFGELKEQGRLPGLDKNEKYSGEFSVFPVNDQLRQKAWFHGFKDVSPQCGKLYLVDFKANQRHLTYFFCADNGAIDLVDSFQLQGQEWRSVSTTAGNAR